MLNNAGAASASAPGAAQNPDQSGETAFVTSDPQYAHERGEVEYQQAHPFFGQMDAIGARRGQARVHGWWTTDDETLKAHKATLSLELQYLSSQGWTTVNTGTKTIKPNQTGRRATASVPCSTDALGQWRSVLDVDIDWMIDDSRKTVSSVQTRTCRP